MRLSLFMRTMLPRRLRRYLGVALLLGLSGVVSGTVLAQSFPSKPIHLIVPYAAGGGVDVVARLVAEQLGRRLGQTVIVENKAGAGSNIGAAYVAKSAPDGYTLLMASPANAINVTLYDHMPYDTVRDLTPVVLVGEVPSVLVVNQDLKAKTLAEFLALAKAEPGKITFGSGGSGASEHLAGALLMLQAGVVMQHVPYRGGSAAMNDLMGGRISSIIENQLGALPFIKSGQVRALAVAGRQRSPELPDVPTFIESGFPDYVVSVWWGLMAPAGTPVSVIDRLNAEVNAALASPDMRTRVEAMSARLLGGTPTQFGTFLDQEIKRWGQAVRASGATAG